MQCPSHFELAGRYLDPDPHLQLPLHTLCILPGDTAKEARNHII